MEYSEIFAGFEELPDVAKGKMFGWDCLKVNGNVFIAGNESGMTFKLDESGRAQALQIKGAQHFDPMGGRPMKEWIFVPPHVLDQTRDLAEEAFRYGSSLPPKKK